MGFQVLVIYFAVFFIALGLVNILNALVNRIFYSGLFKFTGRRAVIHSLLLIISIIAVVTNLVLVFPGTLKEVNPFLALTVFALPLIFHKRILIYWENYTSQKSSRINWSRSVLIAFSLVGGSILAFIGISYFVFSK